MNLARTDLGQAAGPQATYGTRWFIQLLGFFIAYVIAGHFGLALAYVHPSASVVWAPTGIAIAALLLLGQRAAAAIWIAAFLVNLTSSASPPLAALIAIGNTLEAMAGERLARRFVGGTAAFDTTWGVLGFAAVAAAAALVSAAIGVTSLVAAGQANWTTAPVIAVTWWLGDWMGALVVTPPLVLWGRKPHSLNAMNVRTVLPWIVAFALIIAALFGGVFPGLSGRPLTFLCAPPLAYAAFRFGPRGAATATLLLAIGALWGTLRGHGPFALGPDQEGLVLLQTFMGVMGVMSLALGAGADSQRRIEEDLKVAHEDLEYRVERRTADLTHAVRLLRAEILEREAAESLLRESENKLSEAQAVAHVGSWSWDLDADAVTWSDEMYRIFGLEPRSIKIEPGNAWEGVHATDRPVVQRAVEAARAGGQSSECVYRIVRQDGELRWLDSEIRAVQRGARVVRVHGIAHDVTESMTAAAERERLEKELLEVTRREQQRLGQDLHDGLGQHLTGIALMSRTLEQKLKSRDLTQEAREMETIRHLVHEAITKTRSVARGLAPVSLQTEGLAIALQDLALSAETLFSVTCTFECSEPAPSCGEHADMHLYHIAQESITNAMKHGHAKNVRIRLWQEDGQVVLTILDDGSGYQPQDGAAGMGLRIMRHRAQMIGAECEVRPEAGGGTRVTCRVTRPAAD